MKWKLPPGIKVFEALGCIADKRIEMSGHSAKIYSSSKNKFYTVNFDDRRAIMCNDNGSYWQGYLGYPSIAFLMLKGKIKYDEKYSEALKSINWKDINTKFKNDHSKTERYVLDILQKKGIDEKVFLKETEDILGQIKKLNLDMLGKKMRPPEGY